MSAPKPSVPRRVPRTPHPVIDRLRSATGRTDGQLADLLGMDPKGIYESRREGSTPYRHLITAVRANVIKVDLHWLFTGESWDASAQS